MEARPIGYYGGETDVHWVIQWNIHWVIALGSRTEDAP